MIVKPCTDCGIFVDATDAPEGAKIYCEHCYDLRAAKKLSYRLKPKKKKKKKDRVVKERAMKGVIKYPSKEDFPKGVWVTIDEARSFLNLPRQTMWSRIVNHKYQLAYLDKGPLYLDLKSFNKKGYSDNVQL